MSYGDGMVALVVPMHMGALHPMESLVMVALALGPFVALASVIVVVSRRDRRTAPGEGPDQGPRQERGGAGQATRAAELARPEAAPSTTTAAPQSVQQ
jgi:hypothetical protein